MQHFRAEALLAAVAEIAQQRLRQRALVVFERRADARSLMRARIASASRKHGSKVFILIVAVQRALRIKQIARKRSHSGLRMACPCDGLRPSQPDRAVREALPHHAQRIRRSRAVEKHGQLIFSQPRDIAARAALPKPPQRVGRSRPAVTNALRLLSLSPKVLEMVEKGELSAGHARALLTVSEADKQLDAANEVIRKSYSVRKTEQLASLLSKEAKSEPSKATGISVDYAAEVSEQLSKLLGRRVKLTDGKKTGRIELEFYGADDREALINALKKLKTEQ